MSVTSQPLLQLDGVTYMTLKKYDIDRTHLSVAAAKEELSQIIQNTPDANATWGYFPEFDDGSRPYTASKQLADDMMAVLKSDSSLPLPSLNLAFVRLATSEPDSTFGGFHVDVSPGIAHTWTEGVPVDSNILRILFNVYDRPRKLEFYPYLVSDLRQQGYDIPATQYKILEFPDSLKSTTIEIPPMTDESIYCLQFLSNLVPHAGRTYAEGHFLVSYGGYIPGDIMPFAQ